ncbi:OLC1v1016985C1 [Oldenlandia corymbosa var. corymbosa]|uniref:OLC1v1016985C1 n=1 Tax=Oldenlandia corymbosa var. corymbosa TaxID=529605 RepID=A0AAV1E8G1_OLDCO|nr:OLC1v1016985C1 [Oldenlandia corymbosa var. corymbosa]
MNELQISACGKVQKYTANALQLLNSDDAPTVVIKAIGHTIPKAAATMAVTGRLNRYALRVTITISYVESKRNSPSPCKQTRHRRKRSRLCAAKHTAAHESGMPIKHGGSLDGQAAHRGHRRMHQGAMDYSPAGVTTSDSIVEFLGTVENFSSLLPATTAGRCEVKQTAVVSNADATAALGPQHFGDKLGHTYFAKHMHQSTFDQRGNLEDIIPVGARGRSSPVTAARQMALGKRSREFEAIKIGSNSCKRSKVLTELETKVISPEDKRGGLHFNENKASLLLSLFDDFQLQEVAYSGNKSTWTNNRKGQEKILERLDRAFANPLWLDTFSEASVIKLPIRVSNHGPLFLSTIPHKVTLTKHLKFQAFWSKTEVAESILKKI